MNDEVNRRIIMYQHRAKKYYNNRVKLRNFLPSDLVCRKLKATRRSEAQGALALKQEEPVLVSQVFGNGAYKIETFDGEQIPRTWNADNLRKFHE